MGKRRHRKTPTPVMQGYHEPPPRQPTVAAQATEPAELDEPAEDRRELERVRQAARFNELRPNLKEGVSKLDIYALHLGSMDGTFRRVEGGRIYFQDRITHIDFTCRPSEVVHVY